MPNSDKNVFVGVSLQSKWLTKNDFENILNEAKLQFRFRKLVFLVADEIELINQRVFNNGSEINFRKKVELQARKIETEIALACPPGELQSGKIFIRRWVNILDSRYWRVFFELRRVFNENSLFRQDVRFAIEEYSKRRGKIFSEAQTQYLCSYVLHEIPTLLHGITIDNKHYNSMIYPAPKNASIDKICKNLIDEKYGMLSFEKPYCNIHKFEIDLQFDSDLL